MSINNAGPGGSKRVVDLDDDEWRRVPDITLTGRFRMTQARERNEAFSCQVIYCRDQLGMSGARMVCHALPEGKRLAVKYVVVTMYIGGGVGLRRRPFSPPQITQIDTDYWKGNLRKSA